MDADNRTLRSLLLRGQTAALVVELEYVKTCCVHPRVNELLNEACDKLREANKLLWDATKALPV